MKIARSVGITLSLASKLKKKNTHVFVIVYESTDEIKANFPNADESMLATLDLIKSVNDTVVGFVKSCMHKDNDPAFVQVNEHEIVYVVSA